MISLAAAVLLPVALAQPSLVARQEGLKNVTSSEDFDDWLRSANATRHVEVQLPQIHNTSYGDGSDNTTFTAWLKIDDMKKTTEHPKGIQPLAYAGIQPQADVIADNQTVLYDDSWRLCMGIVQFKDHGIPIDEPVHANCSNVFEQDCLDSLQQNLGSNNICVDSDDFLMTSFEEGKCKRKPSEQWASAFNAPEVPDKLINYAVDAPGNTGNLDGSGEATTYDLLAQDVYVLVVGFGQASDDDDAINGVNASSVHGGSRLVCMRADTFNGNSRDLEEIEDVGVGMSASLGWSLLISAATVVMTAAVL